MAEYKLSVPNGVNDFTHGNQSYGAGSTFETDDFCTDTTFHGYKQNDRHAHKPQSRNPAGIMAAQSGTEK